MLEKVTELEKEKMWQMHQKLCSFIKVAKKLYLNPDTVTRYACEFEVAIGVTSIVIIANNN